MKDICRVSTVANWWSNEVRSTDVLFLVRTEYKDEMHNPQEHVDS